MFSPLGVQVYYVRQELFQLCQRYLYVIVKVSHGLVCLVYYQGFMCFC